MPAEIVGHLVRRGMHAGLNCMRRVQSQSQSPDDLQHALANLQEKLRSPGAIATFAITAIVFFLVTTFVEYSIRVVAVNLAAVEDTEPNGAIKLPAGSVDDLAKTPLLDNYDGEAQEHIAQPAKPITSTLRSTFKHLNSIGGARSRLRGLHFGIFYSVVFSLLNVVFSAFFSFIPVLGLAVGRIAAAALTCNLHATWTHATIAMPSTKPFFQNFLPRKTAANLLLPTVRLHAGILVMQGATAGTAALAHRAVAHKGINWLTANAFLLPIVVFLAIAFLHVIPSHIALIRAEASLLPEDRSAIVPFDRTFGGRINWAGFSCRRAFVFQNLTIRGAYKTFDRPTYKRVVKMIVQLFMILTAFSVLFGGIFFAEFVAFAGKEAKEAARFMHFNF